MGLGWVIPEVDISFGAATTLWPSSTKAELNAILLLLLALPVDIQSITVYTDSQAAIDTIVKYNDLSIRAKSKIPNIMIVDQIWRTVKAKQIDLIMYKVKGHSGDFYNDLVDTIVKDAAAKGMVDHACNFWLFTNLHLQLRFSLTWADDNWNGNWRKNFLTLAIMQHNADWAINNVEHSRSVFP